MRLTTPATGTTRVPKSLDVGLQVPAFSGAPPTPAARRSAVLRAAPSGSGNLLTMEQAKKALELQASRSAEARSGAAAVTVPDARYAGPQCGAL